jgi:hypothetical protein
MAERGSTAAQHFTAAVRMAAARRISRLPQPMVAAPPAARWEVARTAAGHRTLRWAHPTAVAVRLTAVAVGLTAAAHMAAGQATITAETSTAAAPFWLCSGRILGLRGSALRAKFRKPAPTANYSGFVQ